MGTAHTAAKDLTFSATTPTHPDQATNFSDNTKTPGFADAQSLFVPAPRAPLSPPHRLRLPDPPAATPIPTRPGALPTAALQAQARDLRRAYAQGDLSEARMLDLLARAFACQRIDLALTPPDPALALAHDPVLCLQHQCLPWHDRDGTIWIATAAPDDFPRALAALFPLGLPPDRQAKAVVASRDAIQRALADLHRAPLTQRMVTRTAAALSARTHPGRALGGMIAILLSCLLALWVAGPLNLPDLLTSLAIGAVAVASLLKVSAALRHLTRPDDQTAPPLPEAPPMVSILVPLYRETRVASALLKRLERLDYPGDRLDILLVLEESDDLTASAIRSARLPPWVRTVTVPEGRPRTKPRAMNHALDFALGEIIGVYDAEDAPDPDQIRKVVARFAAAPPRVACLQGALDYYNTYENWITRCFAIEYNTWFRLIMPGMAKLGFPVPLGGTTIFFRRAALEQVGAWDAHNVTEDADLGMRLARFGYRTEVIDTTTREEASARPVQWMRQRSRWLKGYLMTYMVHMRRPLALLRDLGPWQFLGFQAHFLTAILHFTLAPLLWLLWLVVFGVDLPLLHMDTAPAMRRLALALLGFEVLTILLGAVATRRATHRALWPWLPTLHLYWPMGCIAMWKALIELIAAPYYWDKTPHGHSLPDAPPDPPDQPP